MRTDGKGVDCVTDMEMDLLLLQLENERLTQVNRKLTVALEKAQNKVCQMCRLACMARKIEAKCSTCSNGSDRRNAADGSM